MANGLQDLTYALRRLSKSPGIVAAAVISIALGVAANATIFSIVSTFVLRPAPVGDPATLLSLSSTNRVDCCNSFSRPLYEDVRDRAKSFSGVAAYVPIVPASISGNGEPERIWGESATSNYFDVVRLRMALGRGFSQEEEQAPVIVLSHALWQRRFGADPAIVGKAVTLSGRPFTVVGVAPATFRGMELVLDSEFWVPLGDLPELMPSAGASDRREHNWLEVVARLTPGVTRDRAAAELSLLGQRLAKDYPEAEKDRGFRLDSAGSLPPSQKAAVLTFLAALSVVVLLVLCIACANVTNLLLAQSAARQREMAVRLALGATRARLGRMMLVESVVLALAGGVLGFLLSLWSTQALSAFRLPAPIPIDLSVSVDWRVLLYSFVLSAGSGLLLSIAPAWIASRPVLTSALKGEGALDRPGRRWSLSNMLVVAQISLSLVLLCATGLFLRSMKSASAIDVGFRSRGLLMMAVDPTLHGYTPERTSQFLDQLRDRVSTIPGVASVAVTDMVPLSMGGRRDGFHVIGGPKLAGPEPTADLYMATPGYFKTMGIAAVAGRDFAREGTGSPKVAVINEVFARALFKNENPIGRSVTGGGVTYQIIGVVKQTKSRTIGEEFRPVLYRSLTQNIGGDPSGMGYSLLVRYEGDSLNVANAVRHEINTMDPTLAVFNASTMEEHLHEALFLPRLASVLFGVFGGVGLLLAVVGLYGVISYSVTRRKREISIRMALGAQVGAVQRLIIRQGMLLTMIAVMLGLPAALAVAKFSTSILYGVRPYDQVTFVSMPLLLAAVALLACWIPARRAARVDPMISLRCE